MAKIDFGGVVEDVVEVVLAVGPVEPREVAAEAGQHPAIELGPLGDGRCGGQVGGGGHDERRRRGSRPRPILSCVPDGTFGIPHWSPPHWPDRKAASA